MLPRSLYRPRRDRLNSAYNLVILHCRIAGFFCSTKDNAFQHSIFPQVTDEYLCVSAFQQMRLFIYGRQKKLFRICVRIRAPPSDFDFAYPLKKIEIGGNTHERNQSAGLLPVLYIGCDC